MRLGVRLQLLIALGGMLLVAFVVLFFAVAGYTKVALFELQRDNARAVARAVAGQVLEASVHRSPEALSDVLLAQVGTTGVAGIGLYDKHHRRILGAGEVTPLDALLKEFPPGEERVRPTTGQHGSALAVAVPAGAGTILTLVRTDTSVTRFVPLMNLLALYTGVVGLVLLVVMYFALTFSLVRPLDKISRAASRVADGARRLEVPSTSVRELHQLGHSLQTMTERLLGEEEALRQQITEVERATAELKQAQAQLVQSERLASVGRLAAGLAHEIGNPIAAIIGLQDLLLDGEMDATERQEFLRRMRKETERVNGILRDLLQFARPVAHTGLTSEPGSVQSAVNDTITLVTPQQALEDVDLAVDVYPDLPPVRMSGEHLVQVLLNLVLNAAHACGSGGRITVQARPEQGAVRLVVEDTGSGVPDNIAPQLFEPFFTTKDVGKGTGLGLSVCKGLIEASGGTIHLDPAYTTGARFVVLLPAAQASRPSN